jgi:hypothetical protein
MLPSDWGLHRSTWDLILEVAERCWASDHASDPSIASTLSFPLVRKTREIPCSWLGSDLVAFTPSFYLCKNSPSEPSKAVRAGISFFRCRVVAASRWLWNGAAFGKVSLTWSPAVEKRRKHMLFVRWNAIVVALILQSSSTCARSTLIDYNGWREVESLCTQRGEN